MASLMLLGFDSLALAHVAQTKAKPKSKRKRKKAVSKVTPLKQRSRYETSLNPAQVRAAALAYVTQRTTPVSGHFQGIGALQPFFDRLEALSLGEGPVHILQYGDSHTASDDWVDAMRQVFQQRYGSGGAGFAVAGHPYKGYRRFDIHGESSAGWVTAGTVGHSADGRNGLAGVSIAATRAGETVSLSTSGDQLELSFLRQPGGGTFSLECDGSPMGTVSTEGELGTGFYSVATSPGNHTYVVRTLSSQPVRLFGWVSENRQGVTWETLGINGAQARMIVDWDEALWREQIQRRRPALVILQYGTNEALYPLWTAAQYRADLAAVIRRFRSAVPEAALLLIGPPACGSRKRPVVHLQEVMAIQREIAHREGAAFWDWQWHMRNSGGTALWLAAGLAQGDSIHLTGDGYRLVGKTLAEEMNVEYRAYVTKRSEGN